jgi:hypothetical protein
VDLLFAIALSGAVAVMVNARYKTTELAYVIENADLKLLFTTNRIADYVSFADLLYESLPGLESGGDPLSLRLESAPLLGSVIMMEDPGQDGIVSFSQFMDHAENITPGQAWQRRSRRRSPPSYSPPSPPSCLRWSATPASMQTGCSRYAWSTTWRRRTS